MPGRAGQGLLAILYQLEQSQWWPAEALRARQDRQLRALLAHAAKTVPHFQELFKDLGLEAGAELTAESWTRIPVLSRREVQDSFDDLRSRTLPKSHGPTAEVFTSGSTGMPVKVVKTQLAQLFWQAFTLREHLWHGRDFAKTLAAIRATKSAQAAYPRGARGKSWGPATGSLFATGPALLLDLASKVHEQVAWLQRCDPDYLLTFASNLKALLHYCEERGIRLSALRQVQAISEVLDPETREACRRVWGVPVIDSYSAQETGYIALQCPAHEHFHVQAEGALVEVLDDAGRACGPGEVGQVVVTPLHNFAMPLIRYAIGDLAEVGGPCPCGRGLPVLTRVMGRQRTIVRLPNGERHLANFQDLVKGLDAIVQFQVVRRSEEALEIRLVARRELTAAERDKLADVVRERFQHPFAVTFTYHAEIPRGPGGKFQDYRSDID